MKGNYIPKLHVTLALQILNPARTAEIEITFMNIATEENVSTYLCLTIFMPNATSSESRSVEAPFPLL